MVAIFYARKLLNVQFVIQRCDLPPYNTWISSGVITSKKAYPISKNSHFLAYLMYAYRVVDHFADLTGRKPVEIKLPGTERATKLWRYWMTQEPADFNVLLGNGTRLNPFLELAKKLTFTSSFTMASIYSLIDDILPKEKASKIKELTRKCDEELMVRWKWAPNYVWIGQIYWICVFFFNHFIDNPWWRWRSVLP